MKPRGPLIRTPNIPENVWNYLKISKSQGGWDIDADAMSQLRIFKNVHDFSHYVDLNVRDFQLNNKVDLAEIRYGSIRSLMNNTPCLFLILRFKHDGKDSPSFIEVMPRGFHVNVELLSHTGDTDPLTLGFGNGVPVLRTNMDFETWVAIAIVYTELPNFDRICSENLPVNTSLYVTVQDHNQNHPDRRVHAAWKSGEPATGVPDRRAPGYAITT